MRLTRSIRPTMLLAAAACSASLTAPPSGLRVPFTSIETPDVQVPTITSAGDSVVAVVSDDVGSPCGSGRTVAAGLRGEDLIVTITRHPKDCPPGVVIAPQFPLQIVVHDVPSSTGSLKVVLRLVSSDNATYTVLASGAISID